mmetsp:Transcript_1509/g.3393  ORF Transcript_1509/g.3393 Transcript_1509/m.3393 type:complete len:210 (+) Transcript_1509:92-721(+)
MRDSLLFGGVWRCMMLPSRCPVNITGVRPAAREAVPSPIVTGPRRCTSSDTSIVWPENSKMSGRFPVVITVPDWAPKWIDLFAPPSAMSKPITVVEKSSPVLLLGCVELNVMVSPWLPCTISCVTPLLPTITPPWRYERRSTPRLVMLPDCAVIASRFPVETIVPLTGRTRRLWSVTPSSAGSNSSTVVESDTRNRMCAGRPGAEGRRE